MAPLRIIVPSRYNRAQENFFPLRVSITRQEVRTNPDFTQELSPEPSVIYPVVNCSVAMTSQFNIRRITPDITHDKFRFSAKLNGHFPLIREGDGFLILDGSPGLLGTYHVVTVKLDVTQTFTTLELEEVSV